MIIDEKFLDKEEVLKNNDVLKYMVLQMYTSRYSKIFALATDTETARMSMILNDERFYSEIIELVDRSLTDFEWTILACRAVYKYTFSKIKELYGYDYRHAKAIYEKGCRKLTARYMRFKAQREAYDTEMFNKIEEIEGSASALIQFLKGDFPYAKSPTINEGLEYLSKFKSSHKNKNKDIFTVYSIEKCNLSDTERFEELVKQKGPAVAFAGYLQGEFPKAESSIIDNGLKALKEMQDAYFKEESK